MFVASRLDATNEGWNSWPRSRVFLLLPLVRSVIETAVRDVKHPDSASF
jgi:hypothetical protein